MSFGPYPNQDCFYIEKSQTYLKIQNGVQMAEFLLMRDRGGDSPMVWVVEAKSSSPRPETAHDFDGFIADIKEKFINGLTLGIAAILQRHSTYEELPVPFKELDLSRSSFRFVLVIRGHRDDWLSPIQDALHNALRATIRTWGLPAPSVVVLNDELARQHGLIA